MSLFDEPRRALSGFRGHCNHMDFFEHRAGDNLRKALILAYNDYFLKLSSLIHNPHLEGDVGHYFYW
jgi:hypothetical protein